MHCKIYLTIKVIKAAVSCELVQAEVKTIAYLSKRMIPGLELLCLIAFVGIEKIIRKNAT